MDAIAKAYVRRIERLCALYELCEAQRAVIEEQDDAICAVYEMIGGA